MATSKKEGNFLFDFDSWWIDKYVNKLDKKCWIWGRIRLEIVISVNWKIRSGCKTDVSNKKRNIWRWSHHKKLWKHGFRADLIEHINSRIRA